MTSGNRGPINAVGSRMRARYTAQDQDPVDVEIREFVEQQLRFQSGRLTYIADPDKTAAALARLIDVLASREALTGGEVLEVLGFDSGALDYWTAYDAAFVRDPMTIPSTPGPLLDAPAERGLLIEAFGLDPETTDPASVAARMYELLRAELQQLAQRYIDETDRTSPRLQAFAGGTFLFAEAGDDLVLLPAIEPEPAGQRP